ncbi:MAG: cytochrome c oxidase subunit II, partial [bacterium]
CHSAESATKGPNLEGIYGKQVRLQDGSVVTAEERYLRESLLTPNAKLTEGFSANMPAYQGLMTEEQILQLISYMRTLIPVTTNTGVKTLQPANTYSLGQTPKPEATPAQTIKPVITPIATENNLSGSPKKSEPAK